MLSKLSLLISSTKSKIDKKVTIDQAVILK